MKSCIESNGVRIFPWLLLSGNIFIFFGKKISRDIYIGKGKVQIGFGF
jgi:hypothetical protein